VDIRVTPIPRFVSSTKYKPGSPAIYQQNQFSSLTSPRRTGGTKQSVILTSNRLDKPQTFNTGKQLGSEKNLLLISKKGASKPRVFLKVMPNLNQNISQTPAIPGNNKVMLYQQIERNKSLSNNSELVNRFNYKV